MTTSELHPDLPSDGAIAISRMLSARIRERIVARGGRIPFSEFMRAALYEPGLGYYSGGSLKIGAAGDFVTAPALGDFLADAIVDAFVSVLRAIDGAGVTEIGAGTGAMAAQILARLAANGLGDTRYRILETSGDFRERQQRQLESFGSRVEWLDGLADDGFRGLVVANEVLDALPVERFVKVNGHTRALVVVVKGEGFAHEVGDASPELVGAVARLEAALGHVLPDGFRSEVCLSLGAWIDSLARYLDRGVIVLVDYGLARRDYYHRDRSDGTLISHFRHRAQTDPFVYPGLQDISAWVDFSACADAAARAGLEVAGFTTQGHFLIEALSRADGSAFDARSARELSALKTLILPGEMGERFKVMALAKNVEMAALPGRDLRHRL
jgi:SAM-dependent MidA family methyltransferase